VIGLNPNSPQMLNYFAIHLRQQGKYDEAEATYRKSIQLHWTHSAAYGLESLARERQAHQARR
jgi:Flp pilus assembly protein TadD